MGTKVVEHLDGRKLGKVPGNLGYFYPCLNWLEKMRMFPNEGSIWKTHLHFLTKSSLDALADKQKTMNEM